jgi:hypothetical protein
MMIGESACTSMLSHEQYVSLAELVKFFHQTCLFPDPCHFDLSQSWSSSFEDASFSGDKITSDQALS